MLRELQTQLRLKHYPQRIECFDISTIHGAHAGGSMVACVNGEPDKDGYRRYRIRSVDASAGGDDFAMMLEVLKRRFARGKDQSDLPDPSWWTAEKGNWRWPLRRWRRSA